MLEAIARREVPRWVDQTFRLITHLGGSACTTCICLLLLAIPGTRQLGVVDALSSLVSHLMVQALKRTVVRRRPSVIQSHIAPLCRLPDAYSFPSGHSCAAMALAVTLALGTPEIALPVLVLAGMVGASRVYLRVHYPTDVVAGQMLGVATSLVLWAILA